VGERTSRRSIRGALSGLLGHYTSRYSDYDGYWLFGILVADLNKLKIDLLASDDAIDGAEPLRAAARLARHTFRDQMTKAGVPVSLVREACLEITRSETPSAKGLVNGLVKPGYEVTFVARAVSDLGTAYELACSAFVAPHDPAVEQRSARR
jgi:hypothetical protein